MQGQMSFASTTLRGPRPELRGARQQGRCTAQSVPPLDCHVASAARDDGQKAVGTDGHGLTPWHRRAVAAAPEWNVRRYRPGVMHRAGLHARKPAMAEESQRPGDSQREDAAVACTIHGNRLSDPDPWHMVAQARARRASILPGGYADVLARLRLVPAGVPRPAASSHDGWPVLPGTSRSNGARPCAGAPEQAPAAWLPRQARTRKALRAEALRAGTWPLKGATARASSARGPRRRGWRRCGRWHTTCPPSCPPPARRSAWRCP